MSATLRIDRAWAGYEISAAHPEPLSAQARLDGIGRRMGEFLRAPLREVCAGREDEVWLLPRLDVEVELDLGGDDAALAQTWADGVATAIAAQLGVGSTGDSGGAVTFASAAACLAAFVDEVVDGRAGDRWWHHRRFDGLLPLPAPAAVQAALTAEPVAGRRALNLLSASGRLGAVADVLGERGCGRVLDQLFPTRPAGDPAGFAAGRLLAAGRAEAAGASGPAVASPRATSSPSRSAAPSLTALANPSPVAAGDPPKSSSSGVADSGVEPLSTPLGGACLLVRGMAELGLGAVDGPARLLALRSALGAERASLSAVDGALAFLAGVDVSAPDEPRDLGETILRGLVAIGRAGGRAVSIEPTAAERDPGLLLRDPGLLVRDTVSGAWLAAGDAEDVRGAIDALTAVGGDAPSIVTAADGFAGLDAGELAYFSVPDAAPAAAVAGRALLRELTVRLSGFERSSPGHVWRNLLDRHATLTFDPDGGGVCAELAPAPLDVVLLLAGFDALRFEIPWLGEVRLVLAG